MQKIRIKTIDELFKLYEAGGEDSIYRGMRCESWRLETSLGREAIKLFGKQVRQKKVKKLEDKLLDSFNRHALAHAAFKQPWGRMGLTVIAQHHGLPTRLLDWSQNPLVASFFSVEAESSDDSAVYHLEMPEFKTLSDGNDLLNLSEVIMLKPPHLDPRIPAQAGVFTVHLQPALAFSSDTITKYIIPAQLRPRLKAVLSRYGVNYRTLMPGLDGVAQQLKWFHCERMGK